MESVVHPVVCRNGAGWLRIKAILVANYVECINKSKCTSCRTQGNTLYSPHMYYFLHSHSSAPSRGLLRTPHSFILSLREKFPLGISAVKNSALSLYCSSDESDKHPLQIFTVISLCMCLDQLMLFY